MSFKVIMIEGKPIPFKCDGSTAVKYSRYFNRNIFSDFMELSRSQERIVDSNAVENIAWIMAKTADSNVPDFEEWLSQFSSPMVLYHKAKEILGTFDESFKTTKVPKKKSKKKSRKIRT